MDKQLIDLWILTNLDRESQRDMVRSIIDGYEKRIAELVREVNELGETV